MKKLILGFCAIATMLMVGCSKDSSNGEVPAGNAINFSTYLGRDVQVRSGILDDNNLNDFGVFASYTKSADWTDASGFNFMFNQFVEKDGRAWDYTPKKYWPTKKGEKISFWAYAPYASSEAIAVKSLKESKGLPQITYTISDITTAEDFTAATLMNEVKSATTNPDGNTRSVEFKLRHELTRVNIKAKLDKAVDADTKVNIKSISFLGDDLATDGTYTFGNANTERGTWELGTKGTISVDPLMNKVDTSIGGYEEAGVRLQDTTAVSLFGANKYLFLIPSGGETGTAAAGKIKVKITYDIVTVDTALKDGHSVSTAVKEINLPVGTLKQGKAYLYTLKFYTNQIVLSVSVEGWGDEVGGGDNVDWNDLDK
jgi:hypothetical protein